MTAVQALDEKLYKALRDLHACHRAFSSNDNWTSTDDEARVYAETALDAFEQRRAQAQLTVGATGAEPTEPGAFKAYVVWGDHPEEGARPSVYAFNTEGEKEAFVRGASEMNGWLDFEITDGPDYVVHDGEVLSLEEAAERDLDDADAERTADGQVMPPLTLVGSLELTDENREVDTDQVRDALISEYEAFNKAQGLDLGSADEHLFDTSLTLEQLNWVRSFSRRWELNEQLESEQRRSMRP